MALSKEERDALPDSDFAVPETRDLPIHDERHVRMAWSQVDRTGGLSSKQRAEARRRIIERAKKLGLDTADWQIHAVGYQLEAMSLQMPDDPDHPNRMPFSGILTRVDEPSDAPPNGSTGRRVLIPKEVAEAGLSTLLGMAIDFKPDLTGHDNQSKIGIITEARIEGNAIHIAGFLYASDFPQECARIKAEKTQLGFSYECQAAIADPKADPWVITHVIFTGAAVLQKHLAAYQSTSLAAQAQEDDAMTPEQLKALQDSIATLTASMATVTASVEELKKRPVQAAHATLDLVKPHAEALRKVATAMECAGIGLHAERGHVKVLRHMADHMEAEATTGRLPHIYNDHSYFNAAGDRGTQLPQQDPETKKQLESLTAALDTIKTGFEDLKAKAFQAAKEPERKTISGDIKSLLDKHGLTASAEKGELTVAVVDKTLEAAGITGRSAIAAKLNLRAAGVLKDAA